MNTDTETGTGTGMQECLGKIEWSKIHMVVLVVFVLAFLGILVAQYVAYGCQ